MLGRGFFHWNNIHISFIENRSTLKSYKIAHKQVAAVRSLLFFFLGRKVRQKMQLVTLLKVGHDAVNNVGSIFI